MDPTDPTHARGSPRADPNPNPDLNPDPNPKPNPNRMPGVHHVPQRNDGADGGGSHVRAGYTQGYMQVYTRIGM